MISTLKWLPKGVLKANPDRYELTEADVERMKASGGIDDGSAVAPCESAASPVPTGPALQLDWTGLIAATETETSSGSTRRRSRR